MRRTIRPLFSVGPDSGKGNKKQLFRFQIISLNLFFKQATKDHLTINMSITWQHLFLPMLQFPK